MKWALFAIQSFALFFFVLTCRDLPETERYIYFGGFVLGALYTWSTLMSKAETKAERSAQDIREAEELADKFAEEIGKTEPWLLGRMPEKPKLPPMRKIRE